MSLVSGTKKTLNNSGTHSNLGDHMPTLLIGFVFGMFSGVVLCAWAFDRAVAITQRRVVGP